jgi:hypothetical protein
MASAVQALDSRKAVWCPVKANLILASLLSCVLLWTALATRVEAPRSTYKPQPAIRPGLQVDCTERSRICRMRERLEKVKGKQT